MTAARGKWTFAEAREAFLAEVGRTLARATHVDYANKLGKPELRVLDYRPAGSVSRQEMAEIVAAIHRSGREREAEHVASVIRPMWRWLAEDAQVGRSDVQPGGMTELKAPPRSALPDGVDPKDQPGMYCPAARESGAILAVARSGALHPTMATAFELLVATVQRRRAIPAARIADFRPDGSGAGRWTVAPGDRKGTSRRRRKKKAIKTHTQPLHPPLWARIEAQLARVRDDARTKHSPWLFPQFRARKAGGRSDGHVSEANLNHRLLDMKQFGIEASPHDLRRAFTTFSEDLHGLTLAEVELILDHDEGHDSSDTSDSTYSQALRLGRKRAVLDPWHALMESEAAAAAALPPLDVIKRILADARARRNVAKPGKRRGERAPRAQAA